jgi:hypothetical protein
MPPAILLAMAWAIEVRGVICIPLIVVPVAEEMTTVITSPETMVIVAPVASSI